MREYEIRVFNAEGKQILICPEIHLNDASALRAGKKMAADRSYEVWRDLDMIFNSRTDSSKSE